MQFISSDVATICTGMAASMAAVLLVAGAEGKRSALKHSRVMIHQPMGGAQGQASDIEITAREIQKLKKELYTIITAILLQKPFIVVVYRYRQKSLCIVLPNHILIQKSLYLYRLR